MNITQFLNDRGFTSFEGYCQTCPLQVDESWKLDSTQAIQNYLKHTSAHVTFDLGDHPYVAHAKEYIDAWRLYPSVLMVAIASADLQNAKKLARKNTIVMDDTMYSCMGSSIYDGTYSSMARIR